MSAAPDLSKVNPVSQTSYDSNHQLYDSARPSYPENVVSFAVELGHGDPTSEIAAGTGKFTACLIRHVKSEQLTAVEPSTGMINSFRKNLPNVKIIQASADSSPFPDQTFNTIYIAQAFHWFANRTALEEIHRVMKTGGCLILLWNYEDFDNMDPSGWHYRTVKLMHEYDGSVPQYRRGYWQNVLKESPDLFEAPFNSKMFPYDRPVPSAQAHWDNWHSRSYIAALPQSEIDEIKKKFMSIMDEFSNDKLVAKVGTQVVWLTAK